MKNLKVAANILAACFEDEKKKLETANKDYAKAAYNRRCQMLLEALTIVSCLDEPVDVVPDETDN